MQATVAVFGTLRFPPEKMPEVLPHLKALVKATHEMMTALPTMWPKTLLIPASSGFQSFGPAMKRCPSTFKLLILNRGERFRKDADC